MVCDLDDKEVFLGTTSFDQNNIHRTKINRVQPRLEKILYSILTKP